MLDRIKSFLLNTAGGIAPLTAVMLPLLLGVTAVGVDVSVWAKSNRNLQGAVDAAAIAGAWERAYGATEADAETTAKAEAVNNGFTDSAGNDFDLTYGTAPSGDPMVTASLSNEESKYFSGVLFTKDMFNSVDAAASYTLPDDDFCMLSLGATGTTMTFNGGVTVNSVGCGLAVNSSDPNAALNANGASSDIVVGDVSVVGGIDGEEEIDSPSIDTGVPPFNDPYADLTIPSYTRCTNAQIGNNQEVEVSDLPLAADANGVRVMCSGFAVGPNETVTGAELPPGVYIVECGDFSVHQSGTVTATGVTFILTNCNENPTEYAQLHINGTVTLSAPMPDALDNDWDMYEGVVFYQDRNAPDVVQCNDLSTANATVLIDGVTYFPSQDLCIAGGPSAASATTCSRIIAQTITMSGNPNIANNCAGKGVEDIEGGKPQVTLIQ